MKLNVKVEDGKEKPVYIAENIGEQGPYNGMGARLNGTREAVGG